MVTHNPYESVGNYTGSPQSEAGRLMAAFLQIVDPELPASSVATELARYVRALKKRDQSQA